jgi:hypothetical protein
MTNLYNTTQMNVKLLEAKIWLKAKQINAPRVFVGALTDAFAGVINQINKGMK